MNSEAGHSIEYAAALREAGEHVASLLHSGMYSPAEVVVFARRIYRRAWKDEQRRIRTATRTRGGTK